MSYCNLACEPDFDKVHGFAFMMNFHLLISIMLKIQKTKFI